MVEGFQADIFGCILVGVSDIETGMGSATKSFPGLHSRTESAPEVINPMFGEGEEAADLDAEGEKSRKALLSSHSSIRPHMEALAEDRSEAEEVMGSSRGSEANLASFEGSWARSDSYSPKGVGSERSPGDTAESEAPADAVRRRRRAAAAAATLSSGGSSDGGGSAGTGDGNGEISPGAAPRHASAAESPSASMASPPTGPPAGEIMRSDPSGRFEIALSGPEVPVGSPRGDALRKLELNSAALAEAAGASRGPSFSRSTKGKSARERSAGGKDKGPRHAFDGPRWS